MTEGEKQIHYLLCILTLIGQTAFVAAGCEMSSRAVLCPEKCKCTSVSGNIVSASCTGLRLTSVPADLPATLEYLSLSNNSITDIKDVDFVGCSQMIVLDMSHNKIHSFTRAAYPNNNSRDRRHLHVATNARYNNREKPTHLEQVKSRDRKHRQRMRQRGLKRPFYGLYSIQHLILHHNDLQEIHADAFITIPTLKSLDLSHNLIEYLDDNTFQSLSSLETLNLQYNVLRPTSRRLPENVFDGLTNLTELNLQNNFPRVFSPSEDDCYSDKALSKLTNLKSLFIDGYYSSPSCILGSGFQNLTKLNRLDLHVPGGRCHIRNVSRLFFSNISTSENLDIDLHDCSIDFIHSEAFSFLPTLKRLDLSGNSHLNFSGFEIASLSLCRTHIQFLDISKIDKTDPYLIVYDHYLRHLQNTSLETLIMRHNNIFQIKSLQYVPRSLKVFDVSWNKFNDHLILQSIIPLDHLEMFNASVQNRFYESNVSYSKDSSLHRKGNIKKKTVSVRHSNMVNLTTNANAAVDINNIQTKNMSLQEWKDLLTNNCPGYAQGLSTDRNTVFPMWVPKYKKPAIFEVQLHGANVSLESKPSIFPKNLRELYMSELKLGFVIDASWHIVNNKVLEIFDGSSNLFRCFVGPVHGVPALKVLDLSRNYCPTISTYFFRYMNNLTTVYLSYNSLGPSLAQDVSGQTFSFLPQLETLDLKNNYLQILSPLVFQKNKHLKFILLANNAISRLEAHLSQLTQLTYLDLSSNIFYSLSQENMDDLDSIRKTSNVIVNLLHNPLRCDCSTLSFVSWYHKTLVSLQDREQYECTYINGSTIDFNRVWFLQDEMYRVCHGPIFLSITLALCCCTIITYAFVALAYYYKYKLYFHLYLGQQSVFRHTWWSGNGQQQMRDAFLVFDFQDVQWRRHVLDVLIPNLSREQISYHVAEIGIDQPSPGRPIRDIVEESVLRGRKTVVLLTRDVFLDEENQLAVNMAKIIEEKTHTDVLVFLGVQPLKIRDIPQDIYRFLRTRNIKRYSPDSDEFWKNLAQELKPHSFINELVNNEMR